MAEELSYTISKLAEAAGVTTRTIRFYAAEGLLPAPETQGRYAHYTTAHLQRLRLILHLKNAFLPLSTIRTQVAGLSDGEVESLLERCSALPEKAEEGKIHVRVAQPHAEQSDLETIAQILAVTGQSAQQASTEEPPRKRRALLVSPNLRASESPQNKISTAPASEVWQRIALAPGVELHLHLPEAEETQKRIEQLAEFAKELFPAKGSA